MNEKKYTKKQIAGAIGIIAVGAITSIIFNEIIKKSVVNVVGEILDEDDAKHMTFEEMHKLENEEED